MQRWVLISIYFNATYSFYRRYSSIFLPTSVVDKCCHASALTVLIDTLLAFCTNKRKKAKICFPNMEMNGPHETDSSLSINVHRGQTQYDSQCIQIILIQIGFRCLLHVLNSLNLVKSQLKQAVSLLGISLGHDPATVTKLYFFPGKLPMKYYNQDCFELLHIAIKCFIWV